MKAHLKIFLFVIGIIIFGDVNSQDFGYTVSTDSVSWQELNTQTILNTGNAAWNFSYRIPIGFTFNYLGRNFDSLTIETNGYLVFDADRNYAFTAFNGFGDRVENDGAHAVLGYELSGNVGERILKIQFKDAGPYYHEQIKQTWQLWLKENGRVEVHIGPGNLTENSVSSCRIGLLNQNMDTETRGFFLGGTASSPASYSVNDENPDCALLNSIPRQGYCYIFIPANN